MLASGVRRVVRWAVSHAGEVQGGEGRGWMEAVSRWWLQKATENVCVYASTRQYVCLGSKRICDTHVEQLMQASPMME